jgi:phytoene dehydrogenase-like protein
MKEIAIVGAGVSGMAAAVYCLKSGFRVTLLEKEPASGGVCTSWKRKGYVFEGAVHWLTDSSKTDPLYRLWQDTGILAEGVAVRRNDPCFVYLYEGKEVRLYRDLEKLRSHFLEISPEDAKAVKKLCDDILSLRYLQVPVMDIWGLKTMRKSRLSLSTLFRILPALCRMKRFSRHSALEYAASFSHRGIRRLLGELVIHPEYGSLSLLVTLVSLIYSGVFPEGGSLALARRMEDRVRGLGGNIRFNTKVDKVIVQNGKAAGVLAGGEKLLFDGIILAQDTIRARKLFDNPPEDKWLRELEDRPSVRCTFAGVGVAADLSALPCSFGIDERIQAGGIEYDLLFFNNYASYRGYAPEGHTALTISFSGESYEYWDQHRKNGTYDEQKQLLARDLTRLIEKNLPQTRGKIDVINIATPLTYERYTGSDRGAWMTIMSKNARAAAMPAPVSREIKNLYFAGFRTIAPGGLPVAVYSGFRAAQYACRDFGLVFEKIPG